MYTDCITRERCSSESSDWIWFVNAVTTSELNMFIQLASDKYRILFMTILGKTVAFSLPLLNKILLHKTVESNSTSSISRIHGLILAPTKELCKQIEKHVSDLLYYCRDVLTICALTDDNVTIQLQKIQSKPDIIISTPARLVNQLKAGKIDLSHVKTLVIDEADLVLSFGYAEDVHSITAKMPKIFQGLLMSATLSPELEKFKRVLLHNPAVLKLEEEEKGVGELLQFYLTATENDKFLILYVFIKLGLLQVSRVLIIIPVIIRMIVLPFVVYYLYNQQ